MIKYTGNPHGFLMEDWTHIYRDENTVTRLREHAVIQKNDPAQGVDLQTRRCSSIGIL